MHLGHHRRAQLVNLVAEFGLPGRVADHDMIEATQLYEHESEHDEHLQMRALLTPYFSAKRMLALQPRVQTLVDRLLDDVASGTRPVDLRRALSMPLSVRVLCELLGVLYADHDRFQVLVHGMADTPTGNARTPGRPR